MTRPTPAPLQIGFGLDELRAAITAGRLFLTVGEFSELYRCDDRTARRGIERGDIPAVRVGSVTRIPVAALLRLAGLQPEDETAPVGTTGAVTKLITTPSTTNDASEGHDNDTNHLPPAA
jgi:excisionase family DNA binding protein